MSQFGYLDRMQHEFDEMELEVPIALLGINEAGYDQYNDYMTFGRDIPWLQDTWSENVWGAWEVTYRDVVILDSSNYRHAVFNLTSHDLSDPGNYEALKQILLETP